MVETRYADDSPSCCRARARPGAAQLDVIVTMARRRSGGMGATTAVPIVF